MNAEETVRTALGSISLRHDVVIPYACESGSRAWGFESKDSDYDVRFIYARPREWYMTIDSCSKRDVIDGIEFDAGNMALDVAGWDLRKALQLFRKGNPPLIEWLYSPIVYNNRFGLARDLRDLVSELSIESFRMHYLHMAIGNWKKYLGGEYVSLKKYLYVLRPLCAVRWIDQHGTPPPVNFKELLRGVEAPPSIKVEIETLVCEKMSGAELGIVPRHVVFHEWIEGEFARPMEKKPKEREDVLPALNKIFIKTLEEIGL